MAAFTLNVGDLEFILRQIKVAEAHAAGAPLTQIYVDADGNVVPSTTPGALPAIPDPHVPVGLRTVDGSNNNVVPGREFWGASDQQMPRLLDGSFRNDADGDTFDNNGPAPGGVVTNTNYGNAGNVVDADPRIISNLIVDMSINNPAAISAWFNNAIAVANWTEAHTSEANPNPVPLAPGAPMVPGGIYLTNADLAHIPNIATDVGLTASFNAWMTFFGQFFDHGLDLISKGGNGTVYIPLQPDDPLVLVGPDGQAGTGDEVPAAQQFMVLTRSTDLNGSAAGNEARNTTTPFVDQNQTYTSHASHQVFLREYATVGGKTVSTGGLLDGQTEGLPTWADVKAQALTYLGIRLDDRDVHNIPLLRTDAYGEFIPDPVTGYAQVVLGIGSDGVPNTADDIVVSGTPASPVDLSTATKTVGSTTFTGAVRIGHAFLDDIADSATPSVTGALPKDADSIAGNAIPRDPTTGQKLAYDDELLDKHFITGDGRGNENIGLTTVHHIFHSEHNRQVEAQKLTVLQSGNLAFINEWLLTDLPTGTTLPTTVAGAQALAATLNWDGERLFQAARFATEMQYQHLVFEEFARKIQPAIDPFVFNNATDINPAIFAEFAHTVYRFGHSMLTDNMPRLDASGNAFDTEVGLVKAFTNPVLFDHNGALSPEAAAGSIVRGMTLELGNEIDEFIVSSLRNNLLGLPLDLAALNIARGRETGVPTLNDAREQLYAATGSSFLKPYDHWVDFAANLKNSASVINFIAAYGRHSSILNASTLEAKRDAATLLVMGNVDVNGDGIAETAPSDRIAFLTSTGGWTAANSGLNDIDLWIGGLAEQVMPFGGMLGSTFNAVFEAQLENLQDGDRFYYLTRTQGQNVLVSLEQNSFAKMIMANTDIAQPGPDGIRGTADDVVVRHIGVDSFAKYDMVLEVNAANQADYNGAAPGVDPLGDDPILEALGLGKAIRNDPGTTGADANYLRFTGGEHVVAGGTSGNDTIITDEGDDGIWGDAGDDRIESGAGVDLVNGGAGNDIITDSGDTGDFLKGDEGDDVIANSNGLDILMGGTGKDVLFVGVDDTEVLAGQGDDFILGGDGVDLLMGNEGDDWIEAGAGFDTTDGDNSELFFNSTIIGHDVLFAGSDEHDFDAESGNDIMVQGESVMRNEGMFGFDWAIFKGVPINGYADMNIPIFTTEQADILRNRFDKVEALSGWNGDDTLIGDSRVFTPPVPGDTVGTTEGAFFKDGLDQAGINRIDGLGQIVSVGATGFFESGNILLGGAGDDKLRGNGGDDIIDGDRWLNVRIRITGAGQANAAANQIATVDSLKHTFANTASVPAAWRGRSLFELLIARVIVPSQLHIVREVVTTGATSADVDTAEFNDVFANYAFGVAADGALTVTQTAVSAIVDPLTGRQLLSDGTDTVRNVERLQFSDVTLNVTTGTAGNNTLNGTNGPDLIMGLGGSDTLNGNGGNDILIGGLGNDNLNGGSGDDTYVVGIGDGNDTIQETSGNDTLSVSGAAVVLTALNVSENAGGDLVLQLNGQTAAVTITDHFSNPNAEAVETITFGDITYAGYALAGSYALSSDTAGDRTAAAGVATLLTGQDQGEDLIGDTGNDLLFANGGDDTLNGGAGNDLLVGGTGNDDLIGGVGADVMVGGVGNDTYAVDDAADAVVEAPAAGTDTVETTLAAFTLGDNVENLSFAGAGAFAGTGNALNNVIIGGAAVDTLTGLGGNDTYVVTAGDIIVEAVGGGTDTAQSAATYTLGANFENLTLTGNGNINGTGNGVANVVVGNGGNNTLQGLGGADTLIGGAGTDNINGGTENDWLSGGTGNDTLDGGSGDDVVIGGTGDDTINLASGGNDVLVYNNTGSGADVVNNFDADPAGGQDRIDLSAFGITAGNFGARVVESTIGGAGNTLLTITDVNNSAVGTIRLNGVTNAQIDATDFVLATGTVINGSAAGNTLTSTAVNETINGNNGNDTINYNFNNAGTTNGGRDVVNGGSGTDEFHVEGSGQSEIFRVFTRAAALEQIAGLTLAAGTEIVVTRNLNTAAATAASVIAELSSIEEISIDGNGGTNNYEIIGDFSTTNLDLNTITVNGLEGNDTVDITSLLSAHRILFRSNGGNDTIIGTLRPQDVIELAPGTDLTSYTLADNGNGTKTLSNGTHSITFTGAVPPQFQNTPPPADDDAITGAFELTPRDLQGIKNLVNGIQAFPDDDDTENATGVRDLEGTGNNIDNPNFGAATQPFIRITEAHYGELNAAGNNREINPIFDGLDPRTISNILGVQEPDLAPNSKGANIFFMAFGQYFDHGLDFVPKNAAYGKIAIGGVDIPGPPSSTNPIDLTRAEVFGFDANGVPQHLNKASPFVDQNQAYGSTELVGQLLRESDGNHGFGMHLLTGVPDPSNPQFNLLPTLRELLVHHWNAETVFHDAGLGIGESTLKQFYPTLYNESTGAFDQTALNSVVSNFMGSGYPLLLDMNPFISPLDHYVAGDGRANENFALTSIHTVWARNHNFHVEKLLAAGFQGTAEEIFQAAKMINEAEYQRVVFTEFADMLLGGMRGSGSHAHDEYNPEVDARISHEFAAAVYRVGHSLIGQTMTVIGPDGQPQQVALFDAFLNPSNDPSVVPPPEALPPGYVPQPGYAQHGVNAIIGGIATQQAEEVDFNLVDAVRNDLVRLNADLFSFNVARGRDVGIGTLNQVRADLAASTDPYIAEAVGFAGDLSPYTSWADFQQRNGLSDAVIQQFIEAYPDLVLAADEIEAFRAINPDIEIAIQPDGTGIVKGIDRVDLWVGGLAEAHINDGVVGQTFWVVLHEQFDRLQEGDRLYYLDRFDNFDFYETFVDGQEFADIIARNTGLQNLPEHIFETDVDDDNDDDGDNPGDDGDDDGDNPDNDDDGDDDGDNPGNDDDGDNPGNDDDDDDGDSPGDDDDGDNPGNDDDDNDDDDDDDDSDDDDPCDGDHTNQPPPGPSGPSLSAIVFLGTLASETHAGGGAGDTLAGSDGDDTLFGLAGDDNLSGDTGRDVLVGDLGDDLLLGGDGVDRLLAGEGNDRVFGGDGGDTIFGDGGDDIIFGDGGRDVIDAGSGNDTVFASVGDGDDVVNGGLGSDTLDYSAISANLNINLGANGVGAASSTQSGTDTISGFERVIGGAGDDTITASNAVNVLEGGAGDDTFVFNTAAAADGDSIVGFETGDQIDLRPILSSLGFNDDVANHLTSAPTFNLAGQLRLRVDGGDTIIEGSTDDQADVDFSIHVVGRNLNGNDFT